MAGVTLISIPAWGNMSLLESIWLAIGLVTIVYTSTHLPELFRDVAAVAGARPALRAVAWGYLRRELIRLAQGACIAALGIYASTQSSALPNGRNYTTPTGLILTVILFLLGFLVVGQSVWDWRTRHEVIHQLGLENGEVRPVDAGSSTHDT